MKVQDLTVKTKLSAGADVPLKDLDVDTLYSNYLNYLKWCEVHGQSIDIKPIDEWKEILKTSLPIYPHVYNYIKINDIDFSNYDVIIRSGSALKGLIAANTARDYVTVLTCGDSVYYHPIEKALFQITAKYGETDTIKVNVTKEYACWFYNTVFKKNYNPDEFETVYEVINTYNESNVIYDGNKYKTSIFIPANTTVAFPSGIIYNHQRNHPDENDIKCDMEHGCAIRYIGAMHEYGLGSYTLIDADYPNAFSCILQNHTNENMYIKLEDIVLQMEWKKNIGLFNEVQVLDVERTAGFGSTGN